MSRNNHNILDHVPNQVRDYMRGVNTRFNEICDIYLTGLSIDDLKYLCPYDLINLVPPEQYNHKLLMTIMTKRYIYPQSSDEQPPGCSNHTDDEQDDSHIHGGKKHKCTRSHKCIHDSA